MTVSVSSLAGGYRQQPLQTRLPCQTLKFPKALRTRQARLQRPANLNTGSVDDLSSSPISTSLDKVGATYVPYADFQSFRTADRAVLSAISPLHTII